MIFGIGIDIVHVPRIQRMLSKYPARFLKRIYRDSEIAEFHDRAAKRHQALEYLASRWAVKEAVYKALYPHAVVSWKDSALNASKGKPSLVVDGRLQAAFDRLGVTAAHVSVSHDGEYAVAQIILESRDSPVT